MDVLSTGTPEKRLSRLTLEDSERRITERDGYFPSDLTVTHYGNSPRESVTILNLLFVGPENRGPYIAVQHRWVSDSSQDVLTRDR